MATAQLPTTTTPTPAAPPNPVSASLIQAMDPNRPGAGYINIGGVWDRIMGTSAAGLDAQGNPKAISGATIDYQDAAGNEHIDGPVLTGQLLTDYNNFLNAFHMPDTIGGTDTGGLFAPPEIVNPDQPIGGVGAPLATPPSSGSPIGIPSGPTDVHGSIPLIPATIAFSPTVEAPATPTDPSGIGGSTSAPTGGGSTSASGAASSPTSGPSDTSTASPADDQTNRLIDLIAAEFAGAGVSGGSDSNGTLGLVSEPGATDSTDTTSTTTQAPTSIVPFLVVAALVVGGIWFYMHHKKKAKKAA